MASAKLCQKCAGLLWGRMALVSLSASDSLLSARAAAVRTHTQSWSFTAFRLSHSASPGPPAAERRLTESSLLPYDSPGSNCTATERPSPDSPSLFEDLDRAPPLSPFEEISDDEAVQIVATPPLPPASTSLRDYVSQSETLTKLVQLGVDLWKLEQRRNVGSMLLRLDFQEDIQGRLLFLKDVGLQDSQLGPLITHNPFILTESLENLQARVSYLKSKRFSSEAVCRMVSKAPYLLNFSIQRLDNRLGFFQRHLGLSPLKTRDIVTRLPRLLCGSLEPVKENLKVFELELGFRPNEIQHIATRIPKVLTANKKRLTETFDYVHNTMGVPHSLIAKFPQVLNVRLLRIRERHQFLQYLGKAQYDPAQSGYVSLDRLVSLPDAVFCDEVASATLEDFEQFQKTL